MREHVIKSSDILDMCAGYSDMLGECTEQLERCPKVHRSNGDCLDALVM
jgi:hypothetical protein